MNVTSVSVAKIRAGGPCLGMPSGRQVMTGSSLFVHWSISIRAVDMNGQSSLWLVHSIQFFDWKGVHRRNIPPTVAPGAPEPVKLQPPPPQEPVRSGFPFASLGVGAAAGSPCGAPPPRPPCPNPPWATRDEPITARIAAVHAKSRALVIRCLVIANPLTFQPS